MSLWQLAACIDGYNRSNGEPETEAMSSSEFDDMLSRNRDFISGLH